MQAKIKKIIKVPAGCVMKLTALHNCSKQSVYAALAYNTDSALAVAIRRDALKVFGGVNRIKPPILIYEQMALTLFLI